MRAALDITVTIVLGVACWSLIFVLCRAGYRKARGNVRVR